MAKTIYEKDRRPMANRTKLFIVFMGKGTCDKEEGRAEPLDYAFFQSLTSLV
jgi:hypothetical protein